MSCWSPITLKNQSVTAFKSGKHMSVPCGKCLGCLQRQRADWTIRLSYEEKICKSSAFVTFTYDEWNLPITENGNMTLVKKDLQDYFKRIRTSKMKFFAVGEYGSHTQRPHYHAAIFNVDLERINEKWSKFEGFNNGIPNYSPLGFVKFGDVNQASIHYLTKYMINQEEKDYLDALKPFRLMSKGLGKGYEREINNYCNNHKSNIISLPGGYKGVLPRYYNDKIFSESTRWEIAEKAIKAKDKEKVYSFETVRDHRRYLTAIAAVTSKSNVC